MNQKQIARDKRLGNESCCGKTACCTPDETPTNSEKKKGE